MFNRRFASSRDPVILPLLIMLMPGLALKGQTGTSTCVSMKLQPIKSRWTHKSGADIVYHVEKFSADSRGGIFQYLVIGQDACRGRAQRVVFEWTFDRDLALVRAPNRDVAFRVRFQGQVGRETCINYDASPASYMALYRTGNAISWTPDEQYYADALRARHPGQTPERAFFVGVLPGDLADPNPRAMASYSGHGPEIGFELPGYGKDGGDFFRVAYYFDYERCRDYPATLTPPSPPPVTTPPTAAASNYTLVPESIVNRRFRFTWSTQTSAGYNGILTLLPNGRIAGLSSLNEWVWRLDSRGALSFYHQDGRLTTWFDRVEKVNGRWSLSGAFRLREGVRHKIDEVE